MYVVKCLPTRTHVTKLIITFNRLIVHLIQVVFVSVLSMSEITRPTSYNCVNEICRSRFYVHALSTSNMNYTCH